MKRFKRGAFTTGPWMSCRRNRGTFFKALLWRTEALLWDSAINLPYSGWARQLFSFVYTMGVPISVWTVNDQEDMERLISGGMLNLTTLNVRQALGVRKQILGY